MVGLSEAIYLTGGDVILRADDNGMVMLTFDCKTKKQGEAFERQIDAGLRSGLVKIRLGRVAKEPYKVS